MKRYLTYDDVNIVPKYSELESRSDVDLNTKLTKNVELRIPIVSTPMDTITEYDMALEMMRWGGAGFVHRFMNIDEQVEIIKELKKIRELWVNNQLDIIIGTHAVLYNNIYLT